MRYLYNILLSALILGCSTTAIAGGNGVLYPDYGIEGYRPPNALPERTSPLAQGTPSILTFAPSMLHNELVIDFEKRQVTFARVDNDGNVFAAYHYKELDQYMQDQQQFGFYKVWRATEFITRDKKEEKAFSLDFELPIQYPVWAQRFMGKDPPRLSIDGFERIIVALENTSISPKPPNTSGENSAPSFKQENQFTITGSVGRLVSVNIIAGSDQATEVTNSLKNFKIEYKESSPGELEDEVIQEVVLGYTGFSMPGVQLAGSNEGKQGLFGIRVNSKLGPLTLTTVASHEQGESQKVPLPTNASGGQLQSKNEKEYVRNKFFFLDTVYQRYYNRYAREGEAAPKPPRITELSVWKKMAQTEQAGTSKVMFFDYNDDTLSRFRQLQEADSSYTVDKVRGFIRFDKQISATDVIGIYFKTEPDAAGQILTKGDTVHTTQTPKLWILIKENFNAGDSNFVLMWKNVYEISKDRSGFKFSAFYKAEGNDSTELTADNKRYASILGLCDATGKLYDSREDIFDFTNGFLYIPPYDVSDNGGLPFTNPALGKAINPDIYTKRTDNSEFSDIPPKFILTTNMPGTSAHKTSFSLDWGVMSGSEVVIADGAKLVKDRDYTIDYEMGQLDLISVMAMRAQKVDIEYQKESFVPKSRVFLGLRAESKVPLGDNSLAGLSILYQNTEVGTSAPRVGQEPYNRLLLDVNTNLNFSPAWMTDAVNLIPFVKAVAPSTASISFEVAKSFSTPSGTRAGEAFVDDFEASKQTHSLGTGYQSWYRASPPTGLIDSLLQHPPAWKSYWFTPREEDDKNRIKKTEIWKLPNAGALQASDRYESVLKVVIQPKPKSSLTTQYLNPWAGIMMPISVTFANMKEYQYFEFWAKSSIAGKIKIDMGVISEDLSLDGSTPNSRKNTEDTTELYQGDIPTVDFGLDNKLDTAEYLQVPNIATNTWQILRYNDPLLGEYQTDPGRDNYSEYTAKITTPSYRMNGLQQNHALESEDINYDGILTKRSNEAFFRFEFNMADSTNNPYIVPNTNGLNGFNLYRIPINTKAVSGATIDTIGRPSWSNIRGVRIWWDSFSDSLERSVDTQSCTFAQIQFSGNQWLQFGTAKEESLAVALNTTKIAASVINSDDNSQEYIVPPNAVIQKDDRGYNQKEQSLRLKFPGIKSGEKLMVRRLFNQTQTINLSSYTSLGVAIHLQKPLDDKTQFTFRFGSNDSTFYEFRSPIGAGWNLINITLKNLADLKLAYFTEHGDTAVNFETSQARPDGSTLRILSRGGAPPAFSRISWMAVGLVREASTGNVSDTVDLWVDELKASGLLPVTGFSSQAKLNTQWSDFMTLGASVNYQDGDFHSLSEAQIAPGNATISTNVNASWKLDRFLPDDWGVAIPLATNLSGSISRPPQKPNTDIALTNAPGYNDGLFDMYSDGWELLSGMRSESEKTPAEYYQTGSMSNSWTTGISKARPSSDPVAHILLDKASLDFSYNYTASVTNRGKKPTSDLPYQTRDTNRTYSTNLRYALAAQQPLPDWSRPKPLGFLKFPWVAPEIQDFELSLLNGTITSTIASISYSRGTRVDIKDLPTSSVGMGVNHSVSATYNPTNVLSLDWGLDLQRSLSVEAQELPDGALLIGNTPVFLNSLGNFAGNRFFALDTTFRDYGTTYNEQSRSQNANMRFSPSIVPWFTTTFNYGSSFRQGPVGRNLDATKYLNFDLTNKFSLSSQFQINTLLETFAPKVKDPKKFNFIELMQTGFKTIDLNSIGMEYSANMGLKNSYLDKTFLINEEGFGLGSYTLYTLAILDRTPWNLFMGDLNDVDAFGGMRSRTGYLDSLRLYQNDSRNTTRSFSANTGIRIPDPVPLTLSGSVKVDLAYMVKPDTAYAETTITWPSVSLNASTDVLNKIAFITQFVKGTNLSSTFSHQIQERKNYLLNDKNVTTTTSFAYSPLIQLSTTLAILPISIGHKHSYTIGLSDNDKNNQHSERTEYGTDANATYTITKSAALSDFKIWKWSVPIIGQAGVGATVSYNHTKDIDKATNTTRSDDESFALSPTANYDFTKNVNGKITYNYSRKTSNKITTTSNMFSIIVEIRFR